MRVLEFRLGDRWEVRVTYVDARWVGDNHVWVDRIVGELDGLLERFWVAAGAVVCDDQWRFVSGLVVLGQMETVFAGAAAGFEVQRVGLSGPVMSFTAAIFRCAVVDGGCGGKAAR